MYVSFYLIQPSCKWLYLIYLSYVNLWKPSNNIFLRLALHIKSSPGCAIVIIHSIIVLFCNIPFGPVQPLTDNMQMIIPHIFELSGLKGSSNRTFPHLASHIKPSRWCIWYIFFFFFGPLSNINFPPFVSYGGKLLFNYL